jgi:hypothetical protein
VSESLCQTYVTPILRTGTRKGSRNSETVAYRLNLTFLTERGASILLSETIGFHTDLSLYWEICRKFVDQIAVIAIPEDFEVNDCRTGKPVRTVFTSRPTMRRNGEWLYASRKGA